MRAAGWVLAIVTALASTSGEAAGNDLPNGFVRLVEIAPRIQQDMRYAGADNFTGQRVRGYDAPVCILARPVAEALKRVQGRVSRQGFALRVFDCYRPVRAVSAFLAWAEGGAGKDTRAYHPAIPRSRIVPLGYVARSSSHSRGTAVDLTLVRVPQGPSASREAAPTAAPGHACTEPAPDPTGGLDMGTTFDCFDEKSHTRHSGVRDEAKRNRALLLNAMSAEGFRNYAREWWHFSLPVQGFDKSYDFPVK